MKLSFRETLSTDYFRQRVCKSSEITNKHELFSLIVPLQAKLLDFSQAILPTECVKIILDFFVSDNEEESGIIEEGSEVTNQDTIATGTCLQTLLTFSTC